MRSIFILAAAIFMFSCNEKAAETTDTEEVSTEMVADMSVPDAVTSAFAAEYPDATEVEWEAEGGGYEASFKNGAAEISALYSPDGTKAATEISIDASALPEAVSKAASAMGAITEAAQITNADGSIHYEAEVGGKDYIYDVAGNLIKEEPEEHDDEDED